MSIFKQLCHRKQKFNFFFYYAEFEQSIGSVEETHVILENAGMLFPNRAEVAYRRIDTEIRHKNSTEACALFEHCLGKIKNKYDKTTITLKFIK